MDYCEEKKYEQEIYEYYLRKIFYDKYIKYYLEKFDECYNNLTLKI